MVIKNVNQDKRSKRGGNTPLVPTGWLLISCLVFVHLMIKWTDHRFSLSFVISQAAISALDEASFNCCGHHLCYCAQNWAVAGAIGKWSGWKALQVPHNSPPCSTSIKILKWPAGGAYYAAAVASVVGCYARRMRTIINVNITQRKANRQEKAT